MDGSFSNTLARSKVSFSNAWILVNDCAERCDLGLSNRMYHNKLKNVSKKDPKTVV